MHDILLGLKKLLVKESGSIPILLAHGVGYSILGGKIYICIYVNPEIYVHIYA